MPKDEEPKTEKSKCGAKAKSSKGSCSLPAGWGTDHAGKGRCKYHGGCSTGPRDPAKMRGNKNALKTGERESIFLSTLDEEERQDYEKVDTSPAAQIDEQLRLITIREKRMMQRIADLKAAGEFTIVETEVTWDNTPSDYWQGGKKRYTRDLNKSTRYKETGTLGQIQQIEDALTRVQGQKAKLIALKQQQQLLEPPKEKVDVAPYVAALTAKAGEVWAGHEPEEE